MEDLNKRSFNGYEAPAWANFVALSNGYWYWEESLKQENGAQFQNITSTSPRMYTNKTHKGWEKAYRLPRLPAVAPQPYVVDELPPAPISELYVSTTGRRTASIRLEQTSISIGTNASGQRVRVSVETARAMAHDLIRMAMELERREAE
ncbi:hypothetical protein [Pantoea phage LIMElight]|uniref:Uncharacterized protein n=1 Tax=Pantoea phage LIMElight TaxID=881915 RepID=E1Y3X0_9CAUD|nr:hypothetical protein F370_gp21 [Pantoea phage LIMElight]CBW54779.1 hypothetical protein [Pantoea phage LIMElight]